MKTTSHPGMSLPSLFHGALFCAALLMPLASPAQQTPDTSSTTAPAADEIVSMNPFIVNTSRDTGYGALQSNSLTAFRMDLDKMPATAQVFTKTFMDDVGAWNVMDMLATFSGVVTADPNNTGSAFMMPGDRDGSGGNLGIRGLQATMPKRDGFIGLNTGNRTSLGYLDPFSLDRVELVEGPQSILYGAVGGGGVINAVSKQAMFATTKGSMQYSFDRYGSKRAQVDFNAGSQAFAVRVAALRSSNRSQRYNLGNDNRGIYAQIAIRITKWLNFRILHEGDDTTSTIANTTSIANANFLPAGDPRIGKDMRYLALTGQLADLKGVLWDMDVNYNTISSAAGWWNSERIKNDYNSAVLEASLGHGFSVQLAGVYSETEDYRWFNSIVSAIVPAKGKTGAGNNPHDQTAVQINPQQNFQSDRSRGARLTALHDITLAKGSIRTTTAAGFEYTRQFPAFGSSGIDMYYYKADADWNAIITPTVTTDYGRTPIGATLYIPAGHGFNTRALFKPGSTHITIDGQNYVLQPRIKSDPSKVPATPTNPWSLVPNAPTASNPNAYSGQYNKGADTHRRFMFLSNYTDWWNGRLTTLIGGSLNRYESTNVGQGNTMTIVPQTDAWSWQVGANYRIDWHYLKGLRVYGNMSTSGMAAGTTRDFYGDALKVPKAASPQPELGLKYTTPDSKLIFQFSWNLNTEVQNETRNAGTDYFNAVNPSGINGRWRNGDQWINLDRTASSQGLSISYNPARNWRMRLSITHLDGKIKSDVNYNQLYNDQFHLNPSGVVTYTDGTPVMVDPEAKGGAATTPLTLAMINTINGPWWANPNTNSGSITNGTLRTALTTVDPVHGTAATGATGLPISQMQYDYANPHNGIITVVRTGEQNTGFNEWNLNYQTNYTIDRGPLKGLGMFGTLTTYQRNRAFYTTTLPTSGANNAFTQKRTLVSMPVTTVIGLGINYTIKLNDRMTIVSRLNVSNLLDRSDVWVLPSVANSANLNARLSSQPRNILWTNTLNF